jgi:hypothetical protein
MSMINNDTKKRGTAPDYLLPAYSPEKPVQLPIFPSGKKGVAPVFPSAFLLWLVQIVVDFRLEAGKGRLEIGLIVVRPGRRG